MKFTKNIQEKLGLDVIISLLEAKCVGSIGVERIQNMEFHTHYETLKSILDFTNESIRILTLENPPKISDYEDIRCEFSSLQVEGSFIKLEVLKEFAATWRLVSEQQDFYTSLDAENYPLFTNFANQWQLPVDIAREVYKILDESGEIKDNASEDLFEIRKKIRSKQGQSQKHINKYLTQARTEGWIAENAEITLRNERVVIPMLASHKRKMKGFIHDVSTTGQTIFIEPEEIFNLNNEIVELLNDERLEIIKILKNFTVFLRPYFPQIIQAYNYLGDLDFIRAKARLALEIGAGIPLLQECPIIQWKNARHPLLYLSLKKQGKSVVPLNLQFENKERILIISGPNAGGKSVCLKTVGLLQLMLQYGLPVSMEETSEVGIFEDVFVDIGDQQSIENDLSTYSSHLKNMKNLLEKANEKTLFLCDELGSGTEPQVGGAIAESTIESLEKQGSFGIITTHYTNLKLVADRYDSIVNGAMLFNTEQLKPLYVLQKGIPGSSFAFEMAKNMGIPQSILDSAIEKIGQKHLDFEQQLQELEVEKKQVRQQKLEFELADEVLNTTLQKYNKLVGDLEAKKLEFLKQAREEAKEIIQNANKLVEKTIKEIKEHQAQKEVTQELRKRLVQFDPNRPFEDAPSPSTPPIDPNFQGLQGLYTVKKDKNVRIRPPKKKEPSPEKLKVVSEKIQKAPQIQVGDFVKPYGHQVVSEVIELHEDHAVLFAGSITLKWKLDQLEKVKKPAHTAKPASKISVFTSIQDEKEAFTPNIDIRGNRADEALEKVEKLLDSAALFGEKHLQILHGKGNGVLRSICRSLLQKHPQVKDYSDQVLELGGSGITLVEMV